MPVSKAQQKATNKWIAKAYDRINLTVPKGKKETIQAHAETQGESVNGFINRAIDHQISQDRDRDASEAREGPSGGGVVSLPYEAYKRAVEASEIAGEGLPDFVARAVTIQAQRDKASLAMGIDPHTGGKLEKEA